MFALALTSLRDEAPTFDEQGFLVRGLAYLRGEANGGSRAIRVGHPLGLNALNAALLVKDPAVRLPSEALATGETDFHRPAGLFLWEIGNDVDRTMFLARVPTIWLGLLLAAVAGRWAGQMAAGWGIARGAASAAGLIALALVALDPNILAHTRLVTTDLGLAAGAALGGYTLWRFLRRPSLSSALVAGLGLGLLQNTKFTALLFLPLFGLVVTLALWQRWRALDRRFLSLVFVVYPAAALLTLWAANGLQVGALREPLPLLGTLGGAAVPLSHHLDQLLDIGGRLQVGTPSFLLGRYSDSGWWWYFPVAFALKTPLPVLLLLLYALLRIAKWVFANRVRSGPIERSLSSASDVPLTARPNSTPPALATNAATRHMPPATPNSSFVTSFDLAALLIPAAGYFAIALTTDINLGYRHLLPVLPFLYVLIGVVVAWAADGGAGQRGRAGNRAALVGRVAPLLLLLWLAGAALWIHPHFLSFFNLIAGGPDNGWRALVDSNIDWGQDLARLGAWLDENDVERVWLSYFGEARPEYYGIVYDGLDSFPPRLMNPAARPFYPADPAPGWYAISATTLQGVHFADHDQFRFFRERQPDAKVGYSIFLYDVPPRGAPVDMLLSNTQVDEMAAADFARLGTNDTRLRWFDGGQAVVVPDGQAPVWLLLPPEGELAASLRAYLTYAPDAPEAAGDGYRLYQAEARPPAADRPMQLDGHTLFFGDDSQAKVVGQTLETLTVWRQGGAPRPVKIYIHVRDETGRIVVQWDGLGAAWEGWRVEDTLVQTASIALPDDLPAGSYRVVAGLYDPTTNQRWRFADGQDGVELAQFVRE